MSQLEMYLDSIGLYWMENSQVVVLFAMVQLRVSGSKFQEQRKFCGIVEEERYCLR